MNSLKSSLSGSAAILIGAFQLVGAIAHAEGNTASAEGAGENGAALGEVVVTAQRREERLIDVPVSVSAVGGGVIKNLNIEQPTQLQNIIPNLTVQFDNSVPKVSIRGIGLNDFGGSNEAPIAEYTNDVYIGSVQSPLSQLFDVNRVEVLRGPQGTLFGRNATGGLIQVITNTPTADYSGGASLQYGSYNETVVEANQNIPITDSIRTRTAAIYNREDGWQKNLVTNSRTASTNLFGVRETVDIDLSDSVTNRTLAHYGLEEDLSQMYAFRGTRIPGTKTLCADTVIITNQCVTSDGYRNTNFSPDYTFSSLAKPRNHLLTWGVDNTLKYSTADFVLTSVTAYEVTVSKSDVDGGATANPLYIAQSISNRKQFSQEFRADGDFGAFKWVGGLYYYHEWLPFGSYAGPNLVKALGTTLGFQNQYNQSTDSGAGFGQVDYKVLPALTLTGGIRYTYDKKTLNISDDFDAPHFFNSYSPTTSKVTWKTGLQWQIKDALMAYASVATGVKSAAFNTSLVVANQAVPAAPETNTNYELGLKGETADHKWLGSIAAFYTDYRNFQLVTVPPNGSIATALINVPQAKIHGVEAELTARPLGGLSITGSISGLNTKIVAPGYTANSVPIDGEPLSAAPKFNTKGIVRYDVATNSVGTVSPWFDFSYRSKWYDKSPTTLLQEVPGYALFDAGITWALPNKMWKVDLLVQNAANKVYYTSSTSFSNMDFVDFGKPRTFAGRLSANW
jgi:iron complex outermembrane recepter protein